MIAALLLFASLQATPVPSAAPATQVPVTPAPAASVSPQASPSPSAALTATPAQIDLHPGQSQTIALAHFSGTLAAQLDTPLAAAAIDQQAGTVTITAQQQTGRATLTVTDASGSTVQLPVRVAYDAGTVPAALTVRITGNAVQAPWVTAQITRALNKALQVQPGASAQLGSFALPQTLAPGAAAAVPVPVQIAGGQQYFDVSAVTSVTLQNVAVPLFNASTLFYDDDPEKVIDNGVLFRGSVSQQSPSRLYYYHQNTAQPRRLLVVLSAQTGDPSTVQLIDASAGPNIDVMSVGHAVSRDFLTDKPQNVGLIVDVGPGAPYIADEFSMQPQDGAAGSIGIHVLSGGPLDVTVLSVPVDVQDSQIAQYLNAPRLPGDGHHRTGAFALQGYAQETLAYMVGGEDATTQYGAATPPAVDGAGRDYGEYGVMRTLTFQVRNPQPQPATLYLFEQPLGGVVRSSFLVDGTLDQVGCARLPQRYQIGAPVTVNPGDSRIVVQTMTDGGSNYPLGVGLTSTPPLPATPPISAPDGCFPKPQAAPASPSPGPPSPPGAPQSPSSVPPVVPSPVPEPTG